MPKVSSKITNQPICGNDSIISRHLENRGVRERKKIRPNADLVDIQFIEPDGSRNYVPGRVVEINFQTGSYAYRLFRNAFQVSLTPLVKTEPAVVGGKTWRGMTPFEAKAQGTPEANQKYANFAGIFNPLNGGACCLISEIEVYLDNQLVQAVRDGLLSITNTLNKLFLPADVRQKIVGHPFILHNENSIEIFSISH